MTPYTLIVIFLLTGHAYVEREGLNLHSCAGQLALARRAYLEVQAKLNPKVGEIRFLCLPEEEARARVRKHLTK